MEPLEEMLRAVTVIWEETLAGGTEGVEARAIAGCRAVLAAVEQVAPSLGMVLFGEEQLAQQFHREHFGPLLERSDAVASGMAECTTGHRLDGIVAHMVFGTCLSVAIDARLRGVPLDLDALSVRLARMILAGVASVAPAEAQS